MQILILHLQMNYLVALLIINLLISLKLMANQTELAASLTELAALDGLKAQVNVVDGLVPDAPTTDVSEG